MTLPGAPSCILRAEEEQVPPHLCGWLLQTPYDTADPQGPEQRIHTPEKAAAPAIGLELPRPREVSLVPPVAIDLTAEAMWMFSL